MVVNLNAPTGGEYIAAPVKEYRSCPLCREHLTVTSYDDGLPMYICLNDCPESDIHAALQVPGAAVPTRLRGVGGTDGTGTGTDAPGLHRLDTAQMVREPPPAVEWIAEGLVARRGLTMLTGRAGEGKSMLVGALAAGVAHGESVAGLACQAGKVTYIDAENGAHEIHRRVHALGLPAAVVVFEAEGFDLRHGIDALERLIVAERPDLLVLDSLRSLWGGEENESAAAAAVLDPLRRVVHRHPLGGLVVHHSPKGPGHYRGSSAIAASVDLGFQLARAGDDPDSTRRFLETWKCRPAAEPPKRWLRLTAERGMVLVDQAEALSPESPPEAPAQAELRPRVLAALDATPRPLKEIAQAVGRGPKDGTVRRLLASLAQTGEAVQGPTGWRRCGHGATVPPPMAPDTGHLAMASAEDEAELARLRAKQVAWAEAA